MGSHDPSSLFGNLDSASQSAVEDSPLVKARGISAFTRGYEQPWTSLARQWYTEHMEEMGTKELAAKLLALYEPGIKEAIVYDNEEKEQ